MTKRVVLALLSLTMLLFSANLTYAEELVCGKFFLNEITINETKIENYTLENPLILYHERVYMPLDDVMGKVMGFAVEKDTERNTVKLVITEDREPSAADGIMKNNMEDLTMYTESDTKVTIYKRPTGLVNGEICIPRLNAVRIETGALPVLVRGEVVYIPVSSLVSCEETGWSTYYDAYSGIYISTDKNVDAKDLMDEILSEKHKRMMEYISRKNPKLSGAEIMDMIQYFEDYGKVYGVEPLLLMAMAERESCFTPDIVNSHDCCGLMQIKASTGQSCGFTREQLFTIKSSIHMGAMYLSGNLDTFDGDVTKALSSYNFGTYAVLKGKYSTKYAERVMSRAEDIQTFLVQ